MRLRAISHSVLSARKRIVLVIAVAVSALLGGTLAAVAATGSQAAATRPDTGADARAAQGSAPYIFIHDPTMAREGGTYYVFSTGDPAGSIGNGNIQIRTSANLRTWSYAGTVFAAKPAWITSALGDIPNLWAPDISYFGDAAGTAMTNGGGMEVQGTDAGMIGPGGEFVFAAGGSDYLVYHYYDAFDAGDAWIQVRPLTWVGGWPVTGQALVPVPGQPGPPAS